MSKVVTVFGATSTLGKAICMALCKDYKIRAVTRDPNSQKSSYLNLPGIDLVAIDYNNPSTIFAAVNGSIACFVTTHTDHIDPNGHKTEIAQGKAIGDACVKAGIQHVVFNTKHSVVKTNGIRCRHFDTKAEIEQYYRDIGVPMTCIIVPCLYQDLLTSPLRPCNMDGGKYAFNLPMGYTPLDIIGVDDVGEVVREIIRCRTQFLKKTLSLGGDKLTVKEIAAFFTKALAPKHFYDQQVTVSQYRQMKFPEAEDFAAMFDYFCRVEQKASMDLTKHLNPSLQSLEMWLEENASMVDNAMEYDRAQFKDPWA